jgi:tetratricopeptide (TPR) repeat protein
MSWQCPYCETVNQDAVPVCTVCDRLSPVVESYLSLETIQHAKEYTEKLAQINEFELSGDFPNAISTALEAISVYEDNDVALQKLKEDTKMEVDMNMSSALSDMLSSAVESNEYSNADIVIKLWDKLGFPGESVNKFRSKIYETLTYKEQIRTIIKSATDSILALKPEDALERIEKALLSYPTDGQLKSYRDKIKQFVTELEVCKKNASKARKIYPKPATTSSDTSKDTTVSIEGKREETTSRKRKFPVVKRKTE